MSMSFTIHSSFSPKLVGWFICYPTEVLRKHPNLYHGVAMYKNLNLVVKLNDPRFLRREEAQ
ncbi:hypothetical protein F5Y19DRAFT_460798 [Xylariaceae sp. FL1651]|nr:hypothetical protein F5Y19DRAFT_460798 [Xylariaceae sp. FL1651]